MFAAKEKTFSPSLESTFTWSPRGTYVQTAATSKHHQPSTTRSAEQVVSRFTLEKFRACKSKKSPIGSKVKSAPKSPWPNRRSPEKTLGETRLQLRQTHWAIEMSQYRGYFVPGAVDPDGLQRGPIRVPPVRGQSGTGPRPLLYRNIPGGRNPYDLPTPQEARDRWLRNLEELQREIRRNRGPNPRHNPTPTPTPEPNPNPTPNPGPSRYSGYGCSRPSCHARWGYEGCPQPAKRPTTVLTEWVKDKLIYDTTAWQHKVVNCQKLGRSLRAGACPNGGKQVHCSIRFESKLGLNNSFTSDLEVSVFLCNCCHPYTRGTYARGAHWSTETKTRLDLDSFHSPTNPFTP